MYKTLLLATNDSFVSDMEAGLKEQGIEIEIVGNKKNYIRALKSTIYDSVILDEAYQEEDAGIELIVQATKKTYMNVPILILAHDSDLTKTFALLNEGADFFVEKPFSARKISKALKHLKGLMQKTIDSKLFREEFFKTTTLVGDSKVTSLLRDDLERLVHSNHPILISGPVGTEKVEIAKLLHKHSKREKHRVEVFKSNAHDEQSAKTALFGRLLDPKSNVVGALERAQGGTLVLCEFYYLPQRIQDELLLFINRKELVFAPKAAERLDVRMIFTSSEKVSDLSRRKQVNSTLISKLRHNEVIVPSLAQRKEDIGDMVKQIIHEAASKYGLKEVPFSKSAVIALQSYRWPCNLVQLQNIAESAYLNAVQEDLKEISPNDLSPEIFLSNPANINPSINHEIMSLNLRNARALFEKQFITAQIQRFGGNISNTATFIGMERTALHRKLTTLGIRTDAVKAEFKSFEKRSKLS